MHSIKFTLRTDNPNPAGEHAVILKYSVKGEKAQQRFATGVYVRPAYFQTTPDGGALITDPQLSVTDRSQRQKAMDDLKKKLDHLVYTLQQAGHETPGGQLVKAEFIALLKGKKAAKEDAKKAVLPLAPAAPASSKRLTPIQSFKAFIQASKEGVRLTAKGKKLSKGTLKNYNSTLALLEEFEKETGYTLSWENINYLFYQKLTRFCWDVKGMYDNNTGKKVKEIRSWLTWCAEEKIIPDHLYNKKWIVWKETDTDNFTLNPHELLILDSLTQEDFKGHPYLARTRNLLLLSTFTCVRVSDLMQLTPSAFRQIGDEFYLEMHQIKTTERVRSLALPRLANKYVRWLLDGNFKAYAEQAYNRDLKDLGEFFVGYMQDNARRFLQLGWVTHNYFAPFLKVRFRQGEPVTDKLDIKALWQSHMGRRSGTTYYLVKGLSMLEVMRYTGHKTPQQLLIYESIADRLVGKKFDWSAFDLDARFVIPETSEVAA